MRTERADPLEESKILVRSLRPGDLENVIALDAKIVGRRREEYFKLKLEHALRETGIEISLAAEIEGVFAGILLARVFYGEFGILEQVAVLDTMGVHPEFEGRGIASAMLEQLVKNLGALGISRLQTEVAWDDQKLLSFFQHEGFKPAPRFCLDLDLGT
ncbi:MAG: GNAT family N-acetyltransferase [Planctomycetota bacterium]